MTTDATFDFELSCTETAHELDWEARSTFHPQPPKRMVNRKVRYSTLHVENDQPIHTTLVLKFQRDARGWKMKGLGRKTSGTFSAKSMPSFRVVDGFLSENGKAYWIEQHKTFVDGSWQEKLEKGQVLVKGTFDPTVETFTGVRISDLGRTTMVECPYQQFQLDQVIQTQRVNHHLSMLCADQVMKHAHNEQWGVSFVQRHPDGPVVISHLVPGTMFGQSRLAVGMPIILINHERIQSPQHAIDFLGHCQLGLITIVAFRDEFVFHAPLARRLLSTTLYKAEYTTKTGLSFIKRGDHALFIGHVKEGSLAEMAGLEDFSRVWAINGNCTLESPQAAADLILDTCGSIHIVSDPTGSVDIPITWENDDEPIPDVVVDDITLDVKMPPMPQPQED
eukprot:scaffold5772_cov188-Amphora_coffeaeformis.AAC.9